MKKVNIFSQKRFRVIKNEELAVCAKWFTEPDFYFFTKRPDSLIPGAIDALLRNVLVLVDEKDKPVGLLRYDPEFFGNENCSVCEFRFQNKELYANSMAERIFYSYLHHNFFGSNKYLKKILVRVNAFDHLSINFFKGIEVKTEACLQEYVYKNGKFHDLYIYSISRQEYLRDNGLAINAQVEAVKR